MTFTSKQVESHACDFVFLFCSAFNSAFVARFSSKSKLLEIPEISALPTKFLLLLLLTLS